MGNVKIKSGVCRAQSSSNERNYSFVGLCQSLPAFFRNISESGDAILEQFFTKGQYTFHARKKLRSCVIDSGKLASRTAQVAFLSFVTALA